MLKRIHRLPAHTRLQSPLFVKTSYFTLRIGKNTLPVSRFGFIVSKRVAKQAVVRNRIKRMVRADIEALLPRFASGYDLLFSLTSATIAENAATIQAELETILNAQHLLI